MKLSGLLAYAALGLPLAMASLPIFVIAPDFYGREVGLNLALLGSVIFIARLFDTVQDPFIGRWVDALQKRRGGWRMLMLTGALFTSLGLYLLFAPPKFGTVGICLWLAGSLILVYTGHSLVNICYLTWGARLTDDVAQRSRVTAWREGAGLAGVVLASLLPVWLAQAYGMASGYVRFSLVFAVIMAVCTLLVLRAAPRPAIAPALINTHWRIALRPPAIWRLVLVYGINSLSVSIPATLVLFYISDVIAQPDAAKGNFLAAYFLAGACTLPLWVKLADRIGKARAWLVGMFLACAAFLTAGSLGPQDANVFMWVCILSGMALGADLALPPALLADLIPPALRQDTGLYFGTWAFIGKLALASSGLAFPILAALGYTPGLRAGAHALALVYAGLPCLLKLLAALLLLIWQRHWRPADTVISETYALESPA